jgi:acyl carrier protein
MDRRKIKTPQVKTRKSAGSRQPLKEKDTDLINNEIRVIVSKIARVKPQNIKNNTNLRDELGLSSLNAMEILAVLETKYGIQIDEAKAFDIITAKDLYELVKSYLKT